MQKIANPGANTQIRERRSGVDVLARAANRQRIDA
jgi:hypothetical protein